MRKAAKKAAVSLRRDFAEVEKITITEKGPADFVTAADTRAQSIIAYELGYNRPDFQFLGEESTPNVPGPNGFSGDWWIVDPLDGTTNFLHRLPHFAISIAHVCDGVPQSALIYEPMTDTEYVAVRHGGAWKNETERMRVSGRTILSHSLFATGIPFKGTLTPELHATFLRELSRCMTATAGVRRFGAAALDLVGVAFGAYEGYWERGIHVWDIAAGVLMVQEAGGVVAHLDGSPFTMGRRDIFACAPSIEFSMRDLLELP